IAAEHSNFRGRNETAPQKAECVKLAKPLAVRHITLSARYVFGLAGVHQRDHETFLLQNLMQRNPVDAGGFHHYVSDCANFEPFRHGHKVRRKTAERAHRLRIPVLRHRNVVGLRTDVDSGRVRMQNFYRVKGTTASWLHRGPLQQDVQPWSRVENGRILLNGIAIKPKNVLDFANRTFSKTRDHAQKRAEYSNAVSAIALHNHRSHCTGRIKFLYRTSRPSLVRCS